MNLIYKTRHTLNSYIFFFKGIQPCLLYSMVECILSAQSASSLQDGRNSVIRLGVHSLYNKCVSEVHASDINVLHSCLLVQFDAMQLFTVPDITWSKRNDKVVCSPF
jgi:hypothetical protein